MFGASFRSHPCCHLALLCRSDAIFECELVRVLKYTDHFYRSPLAHNTTMHAAPPPRLELGSRGSVAAAAAAKPRADGRQQLPDHPDLGLGLGPGSRRHPRHVLRPDPCGRRAAAAVFPAASYLGNDASGLRC